MSTQNAQKKNIKIFSGIILAAILIGGSWMALRESQKGKKTVLKLRVYFSKYNQIIRHFENFQI